jgi:hypothetical protein
MEFMKGCKDKQFDLAIVDPPYGGGQHFNFRYGVGDKVYKNIVPNINYFNELFRISKNQIVWGGNYFTDKLPVSRCWISWYKGNPIDSFSDLSIDKRLESVNSFLKEIESVIDFDLLRPILSKNTIGTKNTCGNKAYDSLIMFKILLLQKFYSLSDEEVEVAVKTNIVHMSFVGLSLDDPSPDSSTIGRFRQSLREPTAQLKLLHFLA